MLQNKTELAQPQRASPSQQKTLPGVWLWRGESVYWLCQHYQLSGYGVVSLFTGCQHYQLSGYGVVSVYWLSTPPAVWLWRGECLLAGYNSNPPLIYFEHVFITQCDILC